MPVLLPFPFTPPTSPPPPVRLVLCSDRTWRSADGSGSVILEPAPYKRWRLYVEGYHVCSNVTRTEAQRFVDAYGPSGIVAQMKASITSQVGTEPAPGFFLDATWATDALASMAIAAQMKLAQYGLASPVPPAVVTASQRVSRAHQLAFARALEGTRPTGLPEMYVP